MSSTSFATLRNSMSVEAVIFDMDGVLVDSMRYHVQAWQETFRPLGVNISSYEVYSREGEDWRKTTRDFLRMGGFRPSASLVNKVFKKRSRIFKEIFKPKIFKGTKTLLVLLKKKALKLGLVTATPQRNVNRMLPASIIGLFDVMVCGGDTKKGKPHPEPYRQALKKLRLKPKDVIVIENAPYGITSCKLAGIRCIAVASSLPRQYLKGADLIVGSLRGVKDCFS